MKVGIYTYYLDQNPRSAPSIYQKELIKHLSDSSEVELVLIHHSKNDMHIYKTCREKVISKFPYLGEKQINTLELDIIHFNAIPWSWRILLSKINCKKVATVHGDVHWSEPHLDYNHFIGMLKRRIEPITVKSLDKVVTLSNSLKNNISKFLQYPHDKISVIHPGINHTIFFPRSRKEIEEVRRKYALSNPFILHTSTFSKRKNVRGILESYYYVHKHIPNIRLVIVGPGWKNKYVDNLIRKFELQNKVKLLGWVVKDDLAKLYSGAEVFLFPSYHEEFGFPNIEAMACGTPVISSNRYSIPEITAGSAVLHNPNDFKAIANSIIHIFSDEKLKKELIKKGRERAKSFSWEKTTREIQNLYSRLVYNG